MAPPRQPWLHELATAVAAPTVVLSDLDGQLRPHGAQGVWHADVRVLSRAELRVDGAPPDPVADGSDGTGRARFIGFVRALDGSATDPSVRIERIRGVRPCIVDESIVLTTYVGMASTARIEVVVAADFARIGPVKSGRGADRPAAAPHADGARVRWSAPDARAEIVTEDGATVSVDNDAARLCWTLDLAEPATHRLRWHLHADVGATPLAGAEGAPAWSTPTVSAIAIVQALLGLDADLPAGRLRIAPMRPSPMGRLRVDGLVAGGHAFGVDLAEDGRVGIAPDLPLTVDRG